MASAVALLLMGATIVFVTLLFWARRRAREEELG
jgi:ABC-type sugar transport system permease subunit